MNFYKFVTENVVNNEIDCGALGMLKLGTEDYVALHFLDGIAKFAPDWTFGQLVSFVRGAQAHKLISELIDSGDFGSLDKQRIMDNTLWWAYTIFSVRPKS